MKFHPKFAYLLILSIIAIFFVAPVFAITPPAINQPPPRKPPTWSVSGAVQVDPDGNKGRISDAIVIVKVNNTQLGTTQTDGHGKFKLQDIPYNGAPSATNIYTITASNGISGMKTVSPSPGETVVVTILMTAQ